MNFFKTHKSEKLLLLLGLLVAIISNDVFVIKGVIGLFFLSIIILIVINSFRKNLKKTTLIVTLIFFLISVYTTANKFQSVYELNKVKQQNDKLVKQISHQSDNKDLLISPYAKEFSKIKIVYDETSGNFAAAELLRISDHFLTNIKDKGDTLNSKETLKNAIYPDKLLDLTGVENSNRNINLIINNINEVISDDAKFKHDFLITLDRILKNADRKQLEVVKTNYIIKDERTINLYKDQLLIINKIDEMQKLLIKGLKTNLIHISDDHKKWVIDDEKILNDYNNLTTVFLNNTKHYFIDLDEYNKQYKK